MQLFAPSLSRGAEANMSVRQWKLEAEGSMCSSAIEEVVLESGAFFPRARSAGGQGGLVGGGRMSSSAPVAIATCPRQGSSATKAEQ